MKPLHSHEVPKCLLNQINFKNISYNNYFGDFPYALAHLLMKESHHYDQEYASIYKKLLSIHTYSILDNSLHELGDSIALDTLYGLGEEYLPSHLILPDALHEAKITFNRAKVYLERYNKKSSVKFIGVVQGHNPKEVMDLAKWYNDNTDIDIIAIPFDVLSNNKDKLKRVNIVKEIIKIPKIKPLHLLGAHTPLEFKLYSKEEYKFIKSIDTSAPITYGWNGFSLNSISMETAKPKEKIAEKLDVVLTELQIKQIEENLNIFNKYTK